MQSPIAKVNDETKIRGLSTPVYQLDDAWFTPVPAQEITATVSVSWAEIEGAADYNIYTMENIRMLNSTYRAMSRLRKQYNKRKAQRRARTGRR